MTSIELLEQVLPVEASLAPTTDIQRTALALCDLLACIELVA